MEGGARGVFPAIPNLMFMPQEDPAKRQSGNCGASC